MTLRSTAGLTSFESGSAGSMRGRGRGAAEGSRRWSLRGWDHVLGGSVAVEGFVGGGVAVKGSTTRGAWSFITWLRMEDEWRRDVSLYSAYCPGAEDALAAAVAAAAAEEEGGAAGCEEDAAGGAGRTVDDPGVDEPGVGADEEGRGAVCGARELIESARSFVLPQGATGRG